MESEWDSSAMFTLSSTVTHTQTFFFVTLTNSSHQLSCIPAYTVYETALFLLVNVTLTSIRNNSSRGGGGVFADFHTLPPRGAGCQLRVSTVPACSLDLENYWSASEETGSSSTMQLQYRGMIVQAWWMVWYRIPTWTQRTNWNDYINVIQRYIAFVRLHQAPSKQRRH